ncbi:MAG TPA: nitroreductase family protein [Ignisphaera sp.]|nr:nitroreductase family protein [Ignisphaera sp.]
MAISWCVTVSNCSEFLLTRRSIRVFEEKEVPMDVVLRAIDIARYAPSAKNIQPWTFIIVKERDILDKLAKLHPGAAPLRRAPIAIVVLADSQASPISYLVDGANAVIYLWLALHCLGLGAVWIQTLRNIDEIRKLLNIPDNWVPVAILAIGYPAEKPSPKPRKDLSEIVFINTFGNRYSDIQ